MQRSSHVVEIPAWTRQHFRSKAMAQIVRLEFGPADRRHGRTPACIEPGIAVLEGNELQQRAHGWMHELHDRFAIFRFADLEPHVTAIANDVLLSPSKQFGPPA